MQITALMGSKMDTIIIGILIAAVLIAWNRISIMRLNKLYSPHFKEVGAGEDVVITAPTSQNRSSGKSGGKK